MSDVLGQAIYDHYHDISSDKLWINNKYGPEEEMPVETFLRGIDEMPDLEWLALNSCLGKILDIGAGAGSHSLILQHNNFDVTAIDISPLAVKLMKERGVKNAFFQDIFTYNDAKYDTLLLLMNGIGLAGTLDGLKILLNHLKTLLHGGGQIIFDSSDVSYLYEDSDIPVGVYYGEIAYKYHYKKLQTNWFNWLYVDKHTLQKMAAQTGFTCKILLEDEYGQYLAKLTL
jgi:SAM-dependent methyltransferase